MADPFEGWPFARFWLFVFDWVDLWGWWEVWYRENDLVAMPAGTGSE